MLLNYFEQNNDSEIAVADATFNESMPVFEKDGIVIVQSTISRTSFDMPWDSLPIIKIAFSLKEAS